MKHKIAVSNFSTSKATAAKKLYQENEEKLLRYADRLLWWNQRVNLISRNVSRETAAHHIRHSILISQVDSFQQANQVIDAGTGGGLPGIPLAVLFKEKDFTLNDIVEKKVMACKNIVRDLGLENVKTSSLSIEDVTVPAGSLIISKHAFKVNELYDLVKGRPWEQLILLKGSKEVEGELMGINEQLEITIFDLEKTFEVEFYQGKALVEIKRMDTK
ncbi:MAG: RsmG family class I SAM-dependent methyltransferase [Balneolaceae bacterium]